MGCLMQALAMYSCCQMREQSRPRPLSTLRCRHIPLFRLGQDRSGSKVCKQTDKSIICAISACCVGLDASQAHAKAIHPCCRPHLMIATTHWSSSSCMGRSEGYQCHLLKILQGMLALDTAHPSCQQSPHQDNQCRRYINW